MVEKAGKIHRSDKEKQSLEEIFEYNKEGIKSLFIFERIANELNDIYGNKRTAKAIKAYYHRRKRRATSSQNPLESPLVDPSATSEA